MDVVVVVAAWLGSLGSFSSIKQKQPSSSWTTGPTFIFIMNLVNMEIYLGSIRTRVATVTATINNI